MWFSTFFKKNLESLQHPGSVKIEVEREKTLFARYEQKISTDLYFNDLPWTPTYQIWSLECFKLSLGPCLVVFHSSASPHTTGCTYFETNCCCWAGIIVYYAFPWLVTHNMHHRVVQQVWHCKDPHKPLIYTHMRTTKGHDSPYIPQTTSLNKNKMFTTLPHSSIIASSQQGKRHSSTKKRNWLVVWTSKYLLCNHMSLLETFIFILMRRW